MIISKLHSENVKLKEEYDFEATQRLAIGVVSTLAMIAAFGLYIIPLMFFGIPL